MAQNFTGEVKARGVNGTLMSEAGSATSKGPQISARFTIAVGQQAKDERGQPYDASGVELIWYTTLTENTRERLIDSLTHAGLRRKVAEQFVENTEAGNYGKAPLAAGFGSKVCSLTVEIDEYKGKKKTKVQWVNGPEGGRASKAENAPEMKLDLNVADDDDDTGGADDEAPWNRAE
ncbi:MAG: hypothetical protein VW405_13815 [Rhodospirillaceae bacterium]